MSRAVRLILAAALLAGCQAIGAVEPPVRGERSPAPRALSVETAPAPPATPTTPTDSPTPTASLPLAVAPRSTDPPTLPPPAAYSFDLYQDGDFVPQHTFEWCVGASIQMAHNLISDKRRSSYEDQAALWELARSHSANSFGGANPYGWAAALNDIGAGHYQLVSVPDYGDALRTAARALHETERPVGLVMWRGRHAWVMSGFESIGDPSIHADFSITGIRVLDPLFPHGSGTWGPSPEPNSLLAPEELARQFVVREPRRWSSGLAAGYLLVLPVSDSPAAG